MAAKNLHSYPQIRRAPNIAVRPRETASGRPSQPASSFSSPSKRPLVPNSDGEEEVYDWESSDEERKRKKEASGQGKGKKRMTRSEEEEEAMWDQIDGVAPITPTKKTAPFSFSAGGTSAPPTAIKSSQAPAPATPKSQVAQSSTMPMTPPRTMNKPTNDTSSSQDRFVTPAATPTPSTIAGGSPTRLNSSPEPQDPLALLTSLTPTIDLLRSSLTRQQRLLKANKLSLEAKDKALKAREAEVKRLEEEVKGLRGRVRVLEEERAGWEASRPAR